MTKGLCRSTFLALCTLASPTLAATLIESRDDDGELTRMWIDGNTARLERDGREGHMLLELDSGRLYGVDDARKQAIVLDFGSAPAAADTPPAGAALQERGDGPIIAGYPTRHYVLIADGRTCGDYYLSANALANDDVRRMAGSFRNIRIAADAAASVCDRAAHYAVTQFPKLGIPLRQVDTEGAAQEVVRIQTDTTPSGGLTVPSNYRRLTMEEALEETFRQHQTMGRRQ